ncbi:MAG: flagellar hook-associated protein FlgK [Actinomycetota bacterium]
MGNFGSLNIAYTGLNAHQKRINVIGENIANVNTPGYHRQRVELSPVDNLTRGFISGVGRESGGVQITDVARLRNKTLSDHARAQSATKAARNVAAETLQALEQSVGGLDPGGLHDQMAALFNSFDDLANAPEDPATRQVVLQRAENLSRGFTRTATAMDLVREQTESSATESVRQINALSAEIAFIDQEILGALTVEADPNTLTDQRDTMIDKLAEIADVQVMERSNGQVTLSLDGHLLVSNGKANSIAIEHRTDPALATLGYADVVIVEPSGRELDIRGGKLSADLTALSTTIPDGRRDLESVAIELADQINTIHRTGAGLDGSSGLDLLEVGPDAGQLQVSADVAGQPEKLGAGVPFSGTLDNQTARELAQLADSPTGPMAVFVEGVATLAARVATANSSAEAATVASAQADSLALAAGGVSLDEELTDLITAQRSYDASARLMTAIDEMLQTILNTGLVGR